jgi:twitching motility protein PilT
MAGIDSLLRLMISQGADELRLAIDRPPTMLQRGTPLRLSIPPTDGDMVQHLIGDLLATADGKSEFSHSLDGGESFAVTVRGAGAALEATFKRGAAKAVARPAPAPRPTPAAPAAAPPPSAPTPPTPSSDRLSAEGSALLERAVSLRASDLHLSSGERPTARIDGRLHRLDDISVAEADRLLDECAADEAVRAALAAGRSGDMALSLAEIGRFRVNVYRVGDRLAAAIRVLPRRAPRLADLSFPVPLEELVRVPHGLVIVCGPTGSGKSATLAALAQEALRHRKGVLISLEDPVEYALSAEHGLVRQRQIGRDVHDFATGLRDALREDPDILLIGEMRDPESISLALTAAETGHLVLASLHSRSAAATVERIVDSYPPERQFQIRVQLADSLRAVVAQRLLPRARGGGRLPAVEILRGAPSVSTLIRDAKTAQIANVIQSSRKEGMLSLERCLADLVRASLVDREVALAAANEPASLISYLQS